MFTEWMVHPAWLWAFIAGCVTVVALLAIAAWQHVDDMEGYES